MKMSQRRKLGIVLAGLLVGLVGCASNRVNLVETGRASVKVISAKTVCLSGVQVFQDSEELVVFGRVQRNIRLPYWYAKHIDVAILGPDGTLLHEVKTQGSFEPFPQKSYDKLFFTVRFPVCSPTGATVVVAYHGNVALSKVTSECLRNLELTDLEKKP